MVARYWPVVSTFLSFVVSVNMLVGCKKPPESGGAAGVTAVALLSNSDLNANGTITDEGMKKIEAKSGESGLCVSFIRARLSDAGLAQLAKFQNLCRVDAIGSELSPAAVAKLKEGNPRVEVFK
jgi:hypothetical protein